MNLEQITKNYEEYKEGLDQALHKLDDYKQKCNEEFLLLKAEMLKSPEKIQEESKQSIDEWKKDFEELRSSILFPITCVLPLQTIIAHYLVKNTVPFLNEEVDLIIKTKNPSVRDIRTDDVLSGDSPELPEGQIQLITFSYNDPW